MSEVRFKASATKVARVQLWCPNASGVLIVLAVALSAGGCADQVAQVRPSLFLDSGAPQLGDAATVDVTAADAAGVSEDATAQDWTKRTYVYRGGRDPKTGLARTQL